jgi:hypothetical protein
MTARTRRRSTLRPFIDAEGVHGTLYRFRLKYRDAGAPDFDWFTWAYDTEHAAEKFYDSDDGGWKILSVDRVRDRG